MDKLYWQDYYRQHAAPTNPSLFAQYVMDEHVRGGEKLVELGCGNGRDATFFGSQGVNVLAIDQASDEIDELSSNNPHPTVRYTSGDFTNLAPEHEAYDVVYSRFTLHSITAQEQRAVLTWAAGALRMGGRLCIEARGRKNSLYEMGQPVESQLDAFIFDNHYRRFIDKEALDNEIKDLGLEVLSSQETRGFAPYNDSDDFFIRLIASKATALSLD